MACFLGKHARIRPIWDFLVVPLDEGTLFLSKSCICPMGDRGIAFPVQPPCGQCGGSRYTREWQLKWDIASLDIFSVSKQSSKACLAAAKSSACTLRAEFLGSLLHHSDNADNMACSQHPSKPAVKVKEDCPTEQETSVHKRPELSISIFPTTEACHTTQSRLCVLPSERGSPPSGGLSGASERMGSVPASHQGCTNSFPIQESFPGCWKSDSWGLFCPAANFEIESTLRP